MKFKLDENLPSECADVFRSAGYSSETVGDERLSGIEDRALIEHCSAEDRILVTLDLDFADVRAYAPGSHPGIIVLRPKAQDKQRLLELTSRLVTLLRLSDRSPSKQLWIVDDRRIRIREG